MSLTPEPGRVAWLPWSGDAFARARAERKPILLSLVASWASACDEMDRVSYGDPATAALIEATVIPVRVDADQRPDLADRYDLGGLPTTAFLTVDGELLGGGTFVSSERLRAALGKVAGAAERCLEPSREDAVDALRASEAGDAAALVDLVFAAFDGAHGGFGSTPKFPLTAPVRLAIDIHAETGAREMFECATRTLDAMGWGPLFEEETGSFFRCSSAADWSDPQSPRLLTTNAQLLDLYLYAGEALHQDRWLQRAADVLRYVDGGRIHGAWPLADCGDRAVRFTDANALAVSATLRAAAAFQDDAVGKRSVDSLERILLASYKPGAGVGHTIRGARGLLTDQIAMATANLDAWESTGNIVYRMMAEELVHYALRTMWDDEGGGFFDRDPDVDPGDPVLRRRKPFVLNCDAAILLRRLSDATDDAMFAGRAQQTVDAVRESASQYGPLAAHYLLARRAVLR
jgi:uncharacterized protein YyaL (SSP411 family)